MAGGHRIVIGGKRLLARFDHALVTDPFDNGGKAADGRALIEREDIDRLHRAGLLVAVALREGHARVRSQDLRADVDVLEWNLGMFGAQTDVGGQQGGCGQGGLLAGRRSEVKAAPVGQFAQAVRPGQRDVMGDVNLDSRRELETTPNRSIGDSGCRAGNTAARAAIKRRPYIVERPTRCLQLLDLQ